MFYKKSGIELKQKHMMSKKNKIEFFKKKLRRINYIYWLTHDDDIGDFTFYGAFSFKK